LKIQQKVLAQMINFTEKLCIKFQKQIEELSEKLHQN
jgi:hypothetical protein